MHAKVIGESIAIATSFVFTKILRITCYVVENGFFFLWLNKSGPTDDIFNKMIIMITIPKTMINLSIRI